MDTFHMNIGRFVNCERMCGEMCVRECSQFIAELTAKGIWCRRLSRTSRCHITIFVLAHVSRCFAGEQIHLRALVNSHVERDEEHDSMKMKNET